MNIELRFLQKAIEDKNYISFSSHQKKYEKIKPLKIEVLDNKYILNTDLGKFKFNEISKIKVLRNRF